MPTYDKQKQNMYKQLKIKILLTGTTKINTLYTRHEDQPNGRKSCLDQCFSTHPQKINSHTTHYQSFSDHAMLEINKSAKNIQNSRKYIQIRSLKNFKPEEFKDNIRNHQRYISTLHEKYTNIIANNINVILQESLANMAPIKRIQLSEKKHPDTKSGSKTVNG